MDLTMEEQTNNYHEPVMVAETLEGMAVTSGGRYVDCTLGDGGHAAAILEACAPDGRLLGLDADPEAIAAATERLHTFGSRARLVNTNFAALAEVAREEGLSPVDGVLLDLGVSARQLDAEARGFSFRRAEPLDMRFMPGEGPTADGMVNTLAEGELADLLYRFGEEPRARRIARAVVQARPITDAVHLAEVVRRGSGYARGRTHPATRTFQALRIAVNQELERLEQALAAACAVLAQGGRLVTIAYHSLEDRVVKNFIRSSEEVAAVNKKVIRPAREEVLRNRRSRSARMRVATRQ